MKRFRLAIATAATAAVGLGAVPLFVAPAHADGPLPVVHVDETVDVNSTTAGPHTPRLPVVHVNLTVDPNQFVPVLNVCVFNRDLPVVPSPGCVVTI